MALGMGFDFGHTIDHGTFESSFIMTPRAFARPGFMPIGKFRRADLPCSISQENEGSGFP